MRRRSRRPSREQLAAQSADVERLAAGGIPAAAERRLRALAERPGAFTSDLSVAEFGLLRDARLEPLTQVAGSCVFYVGWQYVGAGWTRPQELTSLATAHTDARRRAVARLRREAELAGADAVVGVRVQSDDVPWGPDLIEVSLIGTAVRGRGLRTPSGPALTTLSGQDCALLLRHGHRPCGIVGGTGVFAGMLRSPDQPVSSWGPMRLNYEYQGATRTWYAARHAALDRLRAEARALDADGVVATRWRQTERHSPTPDLSASVAYTIHALATAIAVGDGPTPVVAATLPLTPKEAPTR